MKKNFANIVTGSRGVLSIGVFFLILNDLLIWASVILILAIATDLFDGKIARGLKIESRLGEILDPIVDKILIVLTTIAILIKIGIDTELAVIIMIIGLLELSVIIIAIKSFFILKEEKIKVNYYGKAKTCFLFLALTLFMITLISGNRSFADVGINILIISAPVGVTNIYYLNKCFKEKKEKEREKEC